MKRLARRQSLSEQVAEVVSKEIGEGRFKMGQMISELQIANELGVSRTPVREAFSRLEYKGLLITVPQSGTYVFDATPEEFQDLSQMRTCLEVQGFQQSLQNAQRELAQDLSEICEKMDNARRNQDQSAYQVLDSLYHKSFVIHSGNKLLSEMYDPISLKVSALINNNSIKGVFSEAAHQDHLEIRNLVSGQKFNQALDLVRAHLNRFGKRRVESLS